LNRLLIIGGGGHGAVVAEAAAKAGHWSDIEFLDDNLDEAATLEYPVVGGLGDMESFLDENTEAVVAIGDNRRRMELLDRVLRSNGSLATVIHPNACISRSATISAATVVCAGVVVNARASVGRGSILNTSATIDHDCIIKPGVHISPGANLAGCVTIGERSWIGIGAAVREGIIIGQDAIVGAGAAVVSNVRDGATVGGVPARELGSEHGD
jgi:sugar O-acyltransferase (sialic acid O-acetyltransferase NeuD family)